MARLNPEALEPGMIVGADVLDHNGRLLASAGTSLSKKHLRVLKSWGIPSVEIRPKDAPDAAEDGAPLTQQEEQRIRERFRHADLEHPLMDELLEQALLRAAVPEKSDEH